MGKDTANYEQSEEMAIAAGKEALNVLWLWDRRVGGKGFFVEMRQNDVVHPKHYSVHCVDGVGTKLFFAPWSGDYASQMQDGIAMNANDFATIINGYPDALDLYLACQTPVEEQHMGEIMKGIRNSLEQIIIPDAPFNLNIGKIETASLDEMINLGVKGKGFDIGVVMTGFIEKDRVPIINPQLGYKIVGVSSTGLHSNGYTGARHVLFTPEVEYRKEWKSQYKGKWQFDDKPDILKGKTVLEAMQAPTALYLREAAEIGRMLGRDVYGVNITGNGLMNFNRAGENVSFEITDPLDPLPIHNLLIQESGWDPETAYRKQNMGMGFGYVVPTLTDAVKLVNARGDNKAKIVGEVRDNKNEGTLRTTIHRPYEGKPIDFVGYNA